MSTAPIAQGPVDVNVMPHTPGPWECFYKHKYDEWHVSVPMSKGSMKWALFDDGVRSENPEADARLISAAPDLLAALNCLLHATMHRDHPAESDMAVAAIAKATLRHNVEVTGDAASLPQGPCGLPGSTPGTNGEQT